jgi:hypothetical protein
VPASYHQEPGTVGALGRLELRDGLKEAYGLRSKYVHNLRDLPHLLDLDLGYRESIQHDRRTLLTIEGLSRVARVVICQFVARQPKVEKEVYDYSLERHGVIRAQLAPQYWIGEPRLLTPDKGRQWLEAFLHQFAERLFSGTPITDLGGVLVKIEELLPISTVGHRAPLIVLYCLYNKLVPDQHRSTKWHEVITQYNNQLSAPQIETLIAHLLLDQEPDWDLEQHGETLDLYFAQRNQRSGFRAPSVFEAGFVLSLAERHRRCGIAGKAAELLTFAVTIFPRLTGCKAWRRISKKARPSIGIL